MSKELHIAMYQDSGECPPGAILLSYAAGHLDAAAAHRVERHLLHCELCAEALEGLGTATPAEITAATDELRARVHDRIGENGRKRRGAWLWLSSAAAVALLVTVTYFLTRDPDPQDLFADSFHPFPAPAVAEAPDKLPAGNTTITDSMVTLTDAQPVPAEAPKAPSPTQPATTATSQSTLSGTKSIPPSAPSMGGTPQSGSRSGVGSSGTGGTGTVTTAAAAPTSSTRSTAESTQPNFDLYAEREEMDFVTANDDAEAGATLDEVSVQESKNNTQETRARKAEALASKEKSTVSSDVQFDAMPAAPGMAMDSVSANALSEGMEAYRQGQYTSAIPLLNEWLGRHPWDHSARFYLAQSLMATGNYDAAGGHLEKILKDTPNSVQEDAAWYLALVRIRQNNTEAARSLLSRLQKDSARYRDRARKLLKQLD